MKTRIAIAIAGVVGLVLILRTSAYYVGVDNLALGVTGVMAAVLLAGLIELWWLATQNARLGRELKALPHPLTDEDLNRASPHLRALLQARLERTSLPLPAPVFAPYMVGLLVMLGLLGTFLGLFETLRGAATALTTSADVEALRAGLRQPMQGLMRSFGTSAAGVASSAVLGLAAVFCRRSAHELGLQLHTLASGPLARYAPAQRQLLALEQLSSQGQAWPEAAKAFQEVSAKLDGLQSRWIESQDRAATVTAEEIKSAGLALLKEIERTLHQVNTLSSRNEQALSELSQRWEQAHETAVKSIAASVKGTIDDVAGSIERGVEQAASRTSQHLTPLLSEAVERSAEATAQYLERFHTQSEALLERLETQHSTRQQTDAERAAELNAKLADSTQQLRDFIEHSISQESARASAAVDLSDRVQGDLSAAIATLRQRESVSAATEQAQREQNQALMTQLQVLTEAVHKTATTQGDHMERLLEAADSRLLDSGEKAQTHLQALTAALEQHAAQQAAQLADYQKEWLDTTTKAGKELLKVETKLIGRHDTLAQKAEAQAAKQMDRLTDIQKTVADQQAERTAALAEVLEKHLAGLQQRLEQSAEVVAQAAELAKSGGAELVTVAETFGAAAEHQRSAAQTWLESLGNVEHMVAEAGEAAAADVLGQHLARTHELFDRQLRFQQELLEQLHGGSKSSAPAKSDAETQQQVADASA